MEEILTKRYSFYNFSRIDGFPNLMPARDEWEVSLPRFSGNDWEVPTEFLLDFYDWIYRLQIIHEDVKIKIFRYSLEGEALDWCRVLPATSITCLKYFHAIFNSFYKERYPVESLFPECCDEFDMFSKQVKGHEESCKHENNMVISEDIKQFHCSHDTLHFPMIKEDDKQQISEHHEESEQQEEVINEHCEDFMNHPLFDEYPKEEVCISPSLEIYSNDPIYDSYESESNEDHKENDV